MVDRSTTMPIPTISRMRAWGWGPRVSNGIDTMRSGAGNAGAVRVAGDVGGGNRHLVHRGNCDGTEPQEFRDGITRERALELLRTDAGTAERAVRTQVTVDLTQSQFDALVSFTFNVGVGAFRRSTLLAELNQGNYDEVPTQLRQWTRAGGRVVRGLERRREAEVELWSNGNYGG